MPRASTVALATIICVALMSVVTVVAKDCDTDNDCVRNSCCGAVNCQSGKADSLSCTGKCEPECVPFTLDCGGRCVCSANKRCSAVLGLIAGNIIGGINGKAAADDKKKKAYGYTKITVRTKA